MDDYYENELSDQAVENLVPCCENCETITEDLDENGLCEICDVEVEV